MVSRDETFINQSLGFLRIHGNVQIKKKGKSVKFLNFLMCEEK